ncbi:MAG: putative Glycosyltransferase, group 1 [Solirubrobacterales bacterium]|nr:putative Glycosyltransferase, group 1 [Solirubrobacterales bacterium]
MSTRAERAEESAGSSPPPEVTLVAHHVGNVGGMERVLTQLALGLRRRGYAVTVIAYACELPAGSGVTFRRVRGPSRPFVLSYPWFMFAATLAVRRRRRGLVLATGAIVLNRVDLVAIHYCHHVGPATPSRASWPFRLNATVSALLGRAAERVCFPFNRPRWFVCVSEGVAEEIREHFPAYAQRTVTIPNGVDVDAFAPGSRGEEVAALREALTIDARQRVAIFVGSEWQRKGLEAVIRALALAEGWLLLVVGGGDRDRYEALAVQAGVADAVRWIGVSRDVAPLYQLADVFVFPTSYEAFPLVALEAAASGLPILATPVNGVRELVADGVNGFLIAADPADIAGRLRTLADDPALLERLGRAARRAALEYSWEKMVERHHQLYSSSSRAPARPEDESVDQPA